MYNKDPELRLTLEDKTSPHYVVIPLIEEKSTILDVGCNSGYLGEYLIKNKKCVCDGIDINKKLLVAAKSKGYRNVYALDLYSSNFKLSGKYDFILLIDILEHLPNPQSVLNKLVKENLKEYGKIIVSLPNIARAESRISHLFGKFSYHKSGIMHQDHLRFFTYKTGKDLIVESGLVIKEVLTTGLHVKVKIFPTLTAFQFIYICEKPKILSSLMDAKKYYSSEESIDKNNTGYSQEQLDFVISALRKEQEKGVGNKLEILDVGCNDGLLTKKYMPYGNVLGIDINKHAIEKCVAAGVFAQVSSVEDVVKKFKGKFDVVIATNIIEHIFDTDQFLSNLKALLKVGGVLILSTPNIASLGRRARLALGLNPFVEYSLVLPTREFNVGHIRYYTAEDIRKQLVLCGFENIKIAGDVINLMKGFYLPYNISRNFPSLCAHLFTIAHKVY